MINGKDGRMTGMARKPGPKPDRLKVDGDWEDAVKKALQAPKPPKKKKDKSSDE